MEGAWNQTFTYIRSIEVLICVKQDDVGGEREGGGYGQSMSGYAWTNLIVTDFAE